MPADQQYSVQFLAFFYFASFVMSIHHFGQYLSAYTDFLRNLFDGPSGLYNFKLNMTPS